MKYYIHRKSNNVYALTENGTVVNETYDCDEYDYNESDLKQNSKEYSEIPQSLYVDYVNDFHRSRNIDILKQNLKQFKTSAIEISEIYEFLDDDITDKLCEKYPFAESFDELTDKISDWVNLMFEKIEN